MKVISLLNYYMISFSISIQQVNNTLYVQSGPEYPRRN